MSFTERIVGVANRVLSLPGTVVGDGGFAVRDGRFVNGVIIGSRGFVGEMASRHSLCFGEIAVKVRQYVLGMVNTQRTDSGLLRLMPHE